MKHQKPVRRTQYLIYPHFQLLLMVGNAIILLIVLGIVGVQVAFAYSRLNEMGLQAHLPAQHPYFDFVQYQAELVYGYLGFSLAIGMILSITLTLILSHRLAGPLVRLKSFFSELARSGKAEPLHFRKGDYLIDLPPLINAGLARVQDENRNRRPG